MKIFCHLKKMGGGMVENVEIDFEVFPSVGDHFATDDSSPWYRVVHVVHTPSQGKRLAGEVYASEVNHYKTLAEWV